MTVNEYLVRRKELNKQMYTLPVYTGLAGMLISGIVLFVAILFVISHLSVAGQQALLIASLATIFVSTFGAYGASYFISGKRYQRFIAAHPEMTKLDHWGRSGFPKDRYPRNEAELVALFPEVREMLTMAAHSVQSWFAFRSAAEKFFADNPTFGWAKEAYMPQINNKADGINKSYLSYWDYWTKTWGINPTGYEDPKIFRETRP